jgi:hypothetical protein
LFVMHLPWPSKITPLPGGRAIKPFFFLAKLSESWLKWFSKWLKVNKCFLSFLVSQKISSFEKYMKRFLYWVL